MEAKVITSAFENFCNRLSNRYDPEAYKVAVEEDWRVGAPAVVLEPDPDGKFGGVASTDGGYVGYLTLVDPDGRPLQEFRWVRKNNNPTWALAFAKDPDGRVWFIGKMRKHSRRQRR